MIDYEDLWSTFQRLALECGEDAFAVIDMPYRRGLDSVWQWTLDDFGVQEFTPGTTWQDVLDGCDETEKAFGPFFTFDRIMFVGSSGAWCLVYTEIPDVGSWATATDAAPQAARNLIQQRWARG